MNVLRILYHMARADFLERTRRYSFLIMLGMVVWLGYVIATGGIVMSVPPNYVGEINSAWVGALMTISVGIFLGLFGFYLVKGSIARDYETGVGQILATTPLSRPIYTLGKWLSNFAVLGVMILILMLAGVVMILLVGKAPLDWWAFISPLLFFALPLMALVAALAVLFETIGWLRGGFGNIVYFFLFFMLIIPALATQTYQSFVDLTGMRLLGDNMMQAAKLAYPGIEGGFSFQAMQSIVEPQKFQYNGPQWTSGILLVRSTLLLCAFGLAIVASVFFDRFNSSKSNPKKGKRDKPSELQAAAPDTVPSPQVHLTPLNAKRSYRFNSLYIAEMKMLLKGRRWWWYMVALGLVAAQLFVSQESIPTFLALAWCWMILLLSELGNREAQHNTLEIVFSAPRPTLNQLPAAWLSAVTVMAMAGSGAFLRYLLSGGTAQLLTWIGGALFIPSLAMGLGTLSLSRKPFEVIYVLWMYIILNDAVTSNNEIPLLDLVGVTHQSPWYVYILLAMGLLVLTAFVRQWQMTGKKASIWR